MEPKRLPTSRNIERLLVVGDERPSLELVYDADTDIAEMETSRIQDEVDSALASLDYALNEKSHRINERLQQLHIISRWLERRYTNISAIEAHLKDYKKWVLDMRKYMSEIQLSGPELEQIKNQIQETTISARVDAEIAEVLNVPDLINVDFIDDSDREASLEKGPLVFFKVDGIAKKEQRPEDELVGDYGQDGYMMNPNTGAVIQWDGVGTFKESYTVGELMAVKLDEILSGIPDTTNTTLIHDYIMERWNEIGNYIFTHLPKDQRGGVVLSASIPLPRSHKMVILKVGDSEVVTGINGVVEERVQAKDYTRRTNAIGVAEKSVGVKRSTKLDGPVEVAVEGTRKRLVYSEEPIIEIVTVPEKATVSVYQTSDGLVANTGKRLVDHIRERTLPQVIQEKPNEKDDMVITKSVTRFE